MCKRLFGFVIVALVLACTESWAVTRTTSSLAATTPASPQIGVSITHEFSPGNNSFVYDFRAADSSTLRVEFVGGVKTTFSLTVTDVTLTDAQLTARLDPRVFPAGTSCFHYFGGGCHEYAFSGNAGGPNGVPRKNVDYGPPIKLTLTYFSPDPVFDPAFGHAPGESTTFSEDILTDYLKVPLEDDEMAGTTPAMSSVIALNRPLEENDTFCWVSPREGQTFKVGKEDEVEVAFRLFASGPCPGNPGTPIRDKDARLSLAKLVNGEFVFQRIRSEHGKHFHFKEGVNETEFSTEGLTPGTYFITVRSTKFPPQTRRIVLGP